MKKINVYLQYPWRIIDSSYYRNLLIYKTPKINFLNKDKVKVVISKRGFKINWALKEIVRRIIGIVKIPNIIYTFNNEAEIIHCAHCLSLNKKPWVVDFENYGALSAGGVEVTHSFIGRKIVKRLLKSRNCKKILPWTEAAKKSLLTEIDDPEIIKKIELLPFALKINKFKSKRKNNHINILFIGRYFRAKGGYIAVEVINELTKKYPNIYGTIISDTPKKVLEKYKKNRRIKFSNLVSPDTLMKEIYPSADIFLYPGFSDTFGFTLVEAMSFKLPIVTFEGFARDEIVIDNKSGFIIKKGKNEVDWMEFMEKKPPIERLKETNRKNKYIKNAIEKTEILVKDEKLRKKMGENGYNLVNDGKFSIKERNKRLEKIYREALK